jgi:hypothetical protein
MMGMINWAKEMEETGKSTLVQLYLLLLSFTQAYMKHGSEKRNEHFLGVKPLCSSRKKSTEIYHQCVTTQQPQKTTTKYHF